ncbi:MAG: response regulator [Candidatus Thorarchaeota archaeon]
MTIRVLVVDDDEDLLYLAEKFLKMADDSFELAGAKTDQEALQKIEEESFDAVVCDHYLGDNSMTGLDLLEWVRNEHPTMPFIILTGRSEETVAIRALNLGADYYLKKGGEEVRDLFSQLAQRIRSEVNSRREEEAQERRQIELERLVEERTRELSETNEQLKQEIEERKRIEDSLLLQRELGNTLCRTDNLTDALDRILKAVVHLAGIDSAGVYLIDSEDGDLNLSSNQGLSAQFIQEFVSDDSADIREPRYFSSAAMSEHRASDPPDTGPSAVGIIPVEFNHRTVALLVVASHSSDRIPNSEKHTLEAIAVQIGGYMARVDATRAIAETQEELLKVFSSLQDIFFIVDPDWKILHANERAQQVTARSSESLSGSDVLDLFDVDSEPFAREVETQTKTGTVFETKIAIRNGQGDPVLTNTCVIRGRHAGKDVFFIISREPCESPGV